MRYKVVVSYDGSKFHGFQRQNNVRNVQSEIEKFLTSFFFEEMKIKAAGRTDAGVHAKGQTISFDTDKSIKNLKREFNRNFNDLKIKKISKVDSDFHPRFSVLEKTYMYKIDLSGKRNENYYLSINYNVDTDKMKSAAKYFIGYHDFRNFVAGDRANYTGYINSIKIYKFNNVLYIIFTGHGFYRYMIRNIVGALLSVGKNKIDEKLIEEMINNPNTRKSLPTALPNGLYLMKIRY